MRKLASVQKVLDVVPIEGADAIELAKINGWQCVVKKGEFRPGDLGVYLEIDAIPPESDVFRFLWEPKGALPGTVTPRPESFRIRTMKLRGALSQGLLVPLQAFDLGAVTVEEDLTERLGVQKYEPPVPQGMGDFRGHFPGFLPKTDETRAQSAPAVLAELQGSPYIITVKCDGTSATFVIDPRDGEFHACGRNLSIVDGPNIYWRVARKYDIEGALRRAGERGQNFAIQGEVVGPGIQKNRLGLSELALAAFNVFDLENGCYLDHDQAKTFLEEHRIPMVDLLEEGPRFAHTLESLLALAEGKYAGTQNEREGIVIRPRTEATSAVLAGRLSFKVISNRFLLKGGD